MPPTSSCLTHSLPALNACVPRLHRRWLPAGSSGLPIDQRSLTLLSEPQEALHFDLASPAGSSGSSNLEVEVAAGGAWNAVLWWFELTLFGGERISTGGWSGCWLLVAGCWWLVAGGWWLVAGGWWLVLCCKVQSKPRCLVDLYVCMGPGRGSWPGLGLWWQDHCMGGCCFHGRPM
jgi:hypothetical protein